MLRIRITLLLACLFGMPAGAETLQVPEAGTAHQDLRGVTMEAVRARFGEPRKILPPVGDPPIIRWIYDGMTVYFERDRVIHVVRHRERPPVPAGR